MRAKNQNLPSEVLDNFFLPDVLRQISNPQMARFAHHNVEQYSPLLGLSFQIRFHVKYSCEKSILVKTDEILDESREFAFSCSSQWMMGIDLAEVYDKVSDWLISSLK